MVIALGAALVVALAVIAYLVWRLADQATAHAAALQAQLIATAAERRELLNRIQRPELIPTTAPAGKAATPPKDLGQLAKVGVIGSIEPSKTEKTA